MKRKYVALPYIIWMVAFIVVPLVFVAYYAFTTKEGGITLSNVFAILDSNHIKATLLSLELSLICTMICLLIAYPLALMMRSLDLKNKSTMLMVLILPMWMNSVLRIMALQIILNKNGIINTVIGLVGLGPFSMLNTKGAIVFGIVYDFLPYMILPIYNAVMDIEDDIIDAAADLGASRFEKIFKIMIPLSKAGIISGITMVFIPSLTSFVIPELLGGGKIQLLGNIIEQEFLTTADYNLGSGLSFALLIFVIIGLLFTEKHEGKDRESNVW